MESQQPESLRKTVKRALRRVHQEFHSRRPHINDNLVKYLAETNGSEDLANSLASYFESVEQLDPALAPSTDNIPAQTLVAPPAKVTGYSSTGALLDLPPSPAVTILLDADATLPQYRFCRASERSVLRETEHFTSFLHCIVTDHEDEGFVDKYVKNFKKRVPLNEQPERQHDSKFLNCIFG